MLHGVREFITNIAISVCLSSFVPLLRKVTCINSETKFLPRYAHLVTHETLLICCRSCVPSFHVVLCTLTLTCFGKVKMNDNTSTVVSFCIFLADLTKKYELLRSRIRDGGQDSGTDFQAKFVFLPAKAHSEYEKQNVDR